MVLKRFLSSHILDVYLFLFFTSALTLLMSGNGIFVDSISLPRLWNRSSHGDLTVQMYQALEGADGQYYIAGITFPLLMVLFYLLGYLRMIVVQARFLPHSFPCSGDVLITIHRLPVFRILLHLSKDTAYRFCSPSP